MNQNKLSKGWRTYISLCGEVQIHQQTMGIVTCSFVGNIGNQEIRINAFDSGGEILAIERLGGLVSNHDVVCI